MSDNPALDAVMSLKRYEEDTEPAELVSLLLHILDRLNKLEEANKYTREDLIKLEVQNDMEAMQKKANDAIRKARDFTYSAEDKEGYPDWWEVYVDKMRDLKKEQEDEVKINNYREFRIYLKGMRDGVKVMK